MPDHSEGRLLPVRGGGSMLTSAAVVDAWQAALDWAAVRWPNRSHTVATLLGDAIALAESGFPVSRSQLFWTNFRRAELANWPGFAKHFLPAGEVPAAGSKLRQLELAHTLRALADDGLHSFYAGPLVSRITDGLATAGSRLTAEDLAATRARIVAPLSTGFAGHELLAPPPPSQGLATLQILGMLERLGIARQAPGSEQFYHLCIEAVKQAFMERDHISDPDMSELELESSLADRHIDAMAAAVDPQIALPWPHAYRNADTVFLGIADGRGRSVSVLRSIYFDWGSGVVVGDTGILWHNRGAAFSTTSGHPNCIAPGKRPFHRLNPGMALRGGKPALLYGTQGADGQPQTLSVLVPALVTHAMAPADALALPRFLLGHTFSDQTDTLKIEAHAGADTLSGLSTRGHRVQEIPAFSPLAGQAGAIRIDERSVIGAHDPRGDGNANTLRPEEMRDA